MKLYSSGAGTNSFGRVPPLFGSKSTISRLGERFRDGQYSLVIFLFAVLLLTVPPPRPQPFVPGVGCHHPHMNRGIDQRQSGQTA